MIDVETQQPESGKGILFSSREAVGEFINSNKVEGIIFAMIMINSIMIGLSTFDFVSKNPEVNNAFDIVDTTFLVIFTFELSLHIYHKGLNFLKDGWVLLDFVLVLASWVFNAAETIKVIRALRILRVLARVENLKQVITSVVAVLPKLGAVSLLMMLVIFIYAILMTELFG